MCDPCYAREGIVELLLWLDLQETFHHEYEPKKIKKTSLQRDKTPSQLVRFKHTQNLDSTDGQPQQSLSLQSVNSWRKKSYTGWDAL
jgi:hypothetical protein